MGVSVAVGTVVATVLGGGVGASAVAAVPAHPTTAAVTETGIRAKTEVLAYLVGDEPGVVISVPSTGAKRTILQGQTVVDPAISPDASELAYTAATPAGPAGLYLEPVDESSAPVLLATLPAADSVAHPHWSPDGTTLVYTRIETDSTRTEVVVDASTGDRVFATADAGADATILPDESNLLSSIDGQAYRTPFDGSGRVWQSEDAEQPVASPLGDVVLYGDSDPTAHGLVQARNLESSGFFGQFAESGPYLGRGQKIDSIAWAADSGHFFVSVGLPSGADPGARSLYESTAFTRRSTLLVDSADDAHAVSAGATARETRPGTLLYTPVTPTRIADTRSTLGGVKGTLGAGRAIELQVAGRGGVPASAASVVVSVTAITPTADTAVTVTPGGTSAGSLTGIRADKGHTTTAEATVGLDAAGRIRLTNRAGSIGAAVDVVGYYDESQGYGMTRVVPIAEPYDTYRPIGAGTSTLRFGWIGDRRVPSDAVAVTASIVLADASTDTRVTVGAAIGPDRASSSLASTTTLSIQPHRRASANVIVPIDPDDGIAIVNQRGSVRYHLVITGYFSPSGLDSFVQLPRARQADSRTRVGVTPGPTPGRPLVVGVAGVPETADAVLVDVTAIPAAKAQFVRASQQVGDEVGGVWAAAGKAAVSGSLVEPDDDGAIQIQEPDAVFTTDVLGYYAQ